MKLFLFGQVGSGKTYVGELLQRQFGIPFYDADWDLPEALRNAISAHQPITEAMRTEFTAAIVRRIALLEQGNKHFVNAQALFKNRHREHLIQTPSDLTLVWVRSSPSVASQRLHERVGHIASSYYAELINPSCEPPTHPHALVENVQNSRQLVSNLAQLLRGVTPKGTPKNAAASRRLAGQLGRSGNLSATLAADRAFPAAVAAFTSECSRPSRHD